MDIYPDMYQIFKHPTKKNRRRVVIQDRELKEIFQFNAAAGYHALFVRKLPNGQVRPYSAREEFCNSEELASIINMYEEVAREPKRYWHILHAIVVGKDAISQAEVVAKIATTDGVEVFQQAMKELVQRHTDPYVQKAKEIEEVNENWVGDLAGKLPEVPRKKTKKGKKDICWTTLEDAKKIVGKNKQEIDEEVPLTLEKRQEIAKTLGWTPLHGVYCGSPDEPCSCDPQDDLCPKCGVQFVNRCGSAYKCPDCGWSEGCS